MNVGNKGGGELISKYLGKYGVRIFVAFADPQPSGISGNRLLGCG